MPILGPCRALQSFLAGKGLSNRYLGALGRCGIDTINELHCCDEAFLTGEVGMHPIHARALRQDLGYQVERQSAGDEEEDHYRGLKVTSTAAARRV